MTDRQPLTNLCNCKAEHWQPHVESCLAYKPRPLLTLENIRSGAFPSDAHAVGFLLGEIELLRDQRDTNLAKEVERIDSLTAQRDHWLEIAREKAAEIERLQFELKAARAELEIADAHIAAKVTAHEPCEQLHEEGDCVECALHVDISSDNEASLLAAREKIVALVLDSTANGDFMATVTHAQITPWKKAKPARDEPGVCSCRPGYTQGCPVHGIMPPTHVQSSPGASREPGPITWSDPLKGLWDKQGASRDASSDDPSKVNCIICGKLWGEHSAQEQADCSAAL